MITSRRLVRTTAAVSATAAAVTAYGVPQRPLAAAAEGASAPAVAVPAEPGASAHPARSKPRPVDCRKSRCVALTFDGGPGRHTPRLLKILKAERVGATFFLLGRRHIDRYPHLVRREAAEGHELANHTWSHPRLTEVSTPEIRRQLSLVQERIKALTGRTPTLMRPPQGRTDERVAKVSRSLGLAQILWSVTAKDYRDHDPQLITRRVLDGARRDGIILLHDIYPGTVPAVPAIIDGLRERGLTPVTVSQLFAPRRPQPGRVYRTAP